MVGAHAATCCGQRSRARGRRRGPGRRPELWPTPPGAPARSLGRRTERAQVGRDEVGTPRRRGRTRAASPTERGGARQRAGGRRRRRPASATPAARWAASQPHEHVVAEGRQPVAAADQVGDGAGVDGAGTAPSEAKAGTSPAPRDRGVPIASCRARRGNPCHVEAWRANIHESTGHQDASAQVKTPGFNIRRGPRP